TPLEALRLQGFPDAYAEQIRSLSIPFISAYKAIGNAVPVNMAAAVIENLMENG
ncbi:DNA cytosine methyltransferase, partial [Rhodoferax sp.]|uniref:DNA cytosine methyltransferase n=1 Tax=Rhodoferax sp. TaxID=50421 RepID=UPI00345B9729